MNLNGTFLMSHTISPNSKRSFLTTEHGFFKLVFYIMFFFCTNMAKQKITSQLKFSFCFHNNLGILNIFFHNFSTFIVYQEHWFCIECHHFQCGGYLGKGHSLWNDSCNIFYFDQCIAQSHRQQCRKKGHSICGYFKPDNICCY